MSESERRALGVYALDDGGEERLVHHYQGGQYALADVAELFEVGTLAEAEAAGETVIVLDRNELRQLRTMAAAYSFDYEDGFIEMCTEMHRFAGAVPGDTVRFVSNFTAEEA